MKFTVSSKLLYDNLSKIQGIVGTNNVISILDNFLFTVDKDNLSVIASDIENTMKVDIPVQSDGAAAIAVPAKKLLDNLKFIPDQPILIQINANDNIMEVQSDKGNYKLAGFSASDFPELSAINDSNSVSMQSSILLHAIQKTLFAISSDESRKAMTGLFCQFDKDGSTFVSTDAQKLVRFKRRDITSKGTHSFILPKKVLNQLRTSLPSDNKDVEILFNKNHCSFKFDNLYLICRLIESQFPDYNAVIPSNNPNILIIQRDELNQTIKRLAPFTSQSTNLIVFHIKGSQLTVTANDTDYASEGKEDLTVNYNGEDITIGFNSKYLMDILSTLNSEEVMIEMSTPGRACLVFPNDTDENESVLMLVMPLMVTG